MPPYRDPAEIAAVAKQNMLDHFGISANVLSDYNFIVDRIRSLDAEKVVT